MISIIAATLIFTDTNPPLPPYKRLQTVTVYADSYEPPTLIAGNVLYTASRYGV